MDACVGDQLKHKALRDDTSHRGIALAFDQVMY